MLLNYARSVPDDQNVIEDAVWQDRQSGQLSLAPNPGWAWFRLTYGERGVQAFTPLETSAGVLEYGFVTGPAARVTIEVGGKYVEAGIAPWPGDPSIVGYWSLRAGQPTQRSTPADQRPVVSVYDDQGTLVDRETLLDQPQNRHDG